MSSFAGIPDKSLSELYDQVSSLADGHAALDPEIRRGWDTDGHYSDEAAITSVLRLGETVIVGVLDRDQAPAEHEELPSYLPIRAAAITRDPDTGTFRLGVIEDVEVGMSIDSTSRERFNLVKMPLVRKLFWQPGSTIEHDDGELPLDASLVDSLESHPQATALLLHAAGIVVEDRFSTGKYTERQVHEGLQGTVALYDAANEAYEQLDQGLIDKIEGLEGHALTGYFLELLDGSVVKISRREREKESRYNLIWQDLQVARAVQPPSTLVKDEHPHLEYDHSITVMSPQGVQTKYSIEAHTMVTTYQIEMLQLEPNQQETQTTEDKISPRNKLIKHLIQGLAEGEQVADNNMLSAPTKRILDAVRVRTWQTLKNRGGDPDMLVAGARQILPLTETYDLPTDLSDEIKRWAGAAN